MKQAILITAYKNYEHLINIALFFDEKFDVYIHLDKKSKVPAPILNKLRAIPQVKLVSRKYKVNWGGLNHLKCILFLAKQAVINKETQRFHVISGHDYPVKSLNYFQEFFIENEANYFSYFPLPDPKWPNGGLDRMEYYNFYDLLNAKKSRRYIIKLVKFQKKLGIKRPISGKTPKLYGGETWWSLNREALDYLLKYTKEKPYFLKRLKFSFCSEEIYVQTVLMNSIYKKTVVNDSLRYIDWSNRNGNFPANLDERDFFNLVNSNKLFARKFDFPISKTLLNKLKDI